MDIMFYIFIAGLILGLIFGYGGCIFLFKPLVNNPSQVKTIGKIEFVDNFTPAVHMRREIRKAEHEIRLQAMAIVSESFYARDADTDGEKDRNHHQGTDILKNLALLTPDHR